MAVLIRLLAGLALLILSTGGVAQAETELEPVDEEEAKVLEPLEVTGYHLKRLDIEGPAPVVVFSREDLQQAGINTLDEFARKLPINKGEQPLRFNTVGAAVFDLRGIGVDATLTLINGLRIAPYAQSAENYIDVNAIPVSAIKRIEILKDGASAIYGADAIAGVVNIILRDGFDGIEFSAGYGVSQESDGEEFLADLVAGYDTGRGSILFTLSWYDREPQAMADRDWSTDADFSSVGGPDRRSGIGSPPTMYRYDTDATQHDPACGTDPGVSSVGDGPYGAEWGTGCHFNFARFQDQFWGLKRFGAGLSGRYEFRPNLSLFGDLLYSEVNADSRQAPISLLYSPLIETITGAPFVPANHPGNPFGAPGELFSRLLEPGPRIHENESRALRAVVGLEGTWSDWDWRFSALASGNEVEKTFRNLVYESRYQLALIGLGGPEGNAWYNPFGYQPENDPVLVDWLTTDAVRRDDSDEASVDLLFSRLFGSLPGGPAGIAVGLQYREQDLSQWADENLLSGDVGHIAQPISADRDIFSAYMEFSLPLLDKLEAQLALRYEDYSDFGATTNPKIAVRWQPLDSLMFRGSWSTSFKPPSFYELYAPDQYSWDWYIDIERCDLKGLEQDCDYWLYSMSWGGNPELGAEDGESWFAGTLWTPEIAPGFELQLDFWRFEHEDRIEFLDPQLVLDEKGDFGITRAPAEPDGTPGRIVAVRWTVINYDALETQGIDTTLRYLWQTRRAGEVRFSLVHTYIDEWKYTDSLQESLIDENYAGTWRYPAHRADFNISWEKGRHGAAANAHYTGSYENHTDMYVNGERTDQPMTIGSHTTVDLQYRYAFEGLRGAVLQIGVNNVTDEPPPITYGGLEPFHDGRGRYYYFRWKQPIR